MAVVHRTTRQFHDALADTVSTCPFSNGVVGAFAEFLAAYGYDGDIETVRWHRDFYATV